MTLAVWVAVGAAAGACAGEGSAGPAYVVHDSAGVRIVEAGSPGALEPWRRPGPEPLFRTGWEATDPQWGDLASGALLSNGRAAVADRASAEIAWLGADGQVERVAGGPGGGPGELGPVFGVLVVGHDTVVVQELFGGRTTLFHEGALVRTLGAQGPFPSREAVAVDAEGMLLLAGMPDSFVPDFPDPWLQLPLYRLDLETGAPETVAHVDFAQNRDLVGYNPFAAAGHSTAWVHGFVFGRGNEPQLTWMDLQGQVTQRFRWEADDVPFTEAAWRAYEEGLRMNWAGSPDALDDFLERQRAEARGPLPVFSRLHSDSEGNVWVAAYEPGDHRQASRYMVVSSEGEWLGTVDVPRGLQLLDIGRDLLLGVERDPLGVEAVVVYRLER